MEQACCLHLMLYLAGGYHIFFELFDTMALPLSSIELCPVQRTLEELFIKGPIANTRDNPEFHQVHLQYTPVLLHVHCLHIAVYAYYLVHYHWHRVSIVAVDVAMCGETW